MRVVVAGALANKPGYGGEAWVRTAWARGLAELGADVLFLEVLDPETVGADPLRLRDLRASPHARYFDAVCSDRGISEASALVDSRGRSISGRPSSEVRDFCEGADLLVNISGHLGESDLLRSARRRAYVDLDPGFTQFWMAEGVEGLGIRDHEVHFTVGENVGTRHSTIPSNGVRWLPLRQPVDLEEWRVADPPEELRFTTVASWRGSYGPVTFEGRTYGLKVHEFRRFARLPQEVEAHLEVALDIHPDDDRDRRMLEGYGWKLSDPRMEARTPRAFRRYLRRSGGEFSVAQGIYVATRSGWFSDRSARYLATGRPVVVQDTGFGRTVPVGDGILSFDDVGTAARSVRRVVEEYDHHRAAARQIAEEFFDARIVLTSFLERALDPGMPSQPGSAVRSPLLASPPSPNGDGTGGAPFVVDSGERGRVLVSGMIAGVPNQGGAAWAVLQYLLGLERLGWDVHFVEEVDPGDLRPHGATLERSVNARYFRRVLRNFDLGGRAALVERGTRRAVGLPFEELERVAGDCDVLLNLSGGLSPFLFPGIPVRVYLDLDPAFTQLWRELDGIDMGFEGHTHFATVGLSLDTGKNGIPTCGREWIRTLPPVVLQSWPRGEIPAPRDAWTTVANWRGYGSVEWNGRHLGQKAHSFRGLMELPSLSGDRFEVALAIHPDEEEDLRRLRSGGWRLLDPGRVAGDPDSYRRFIRESAAELGIAKTGYVESRSGWFSDRSACYLASGRPVLAQDTGFSEHLPTGLGLVAFDDLEGAVEGVGMIRRDYAAHARAARAVAESYLDSDRVLSRLMKELLRAPTGFDGRRAGAERDPTPPVRPGTTRPPGRTP